MAVLVPDVSFWQDDNATARKIDFSRMVLKDAGGVIIRAGQNAWPDPDFTDYWLASKQSGLPRGSYFFYDSRANPVTQAELYLRQLGGDFGELPMFVDLEDSYHGGYDGFYYWQTFIERLRESNHDHEVGIYTRASWLDLYNLTSAQIQYLRQFCLWIAHYTTSLTPLVPRGWGQNEWTLHQYTDREDGYAWGVESRQIDMSRFNGDAPAFRARFKLGGSVPVVRVKDTEQHTEPFPGVKYHRVFRFGSWCSILQIPTAGKKMGVSKFGLKKPSEWAQSLGAQIVVNGGDFNAYHAVGVHASDGVVYSGQLEWQPFVNYPKAGGAHINPFDSREVKYNALAGKRFIVQNGRQATSTSAAWYEVHPRTIEGVNQAGDVSIKVVIDGRQNPYSVGATLFEAAQIAIEFGAWTATDLDGGGSSAMIINGKVVNYPIDYNIPDTERRVGTVTYVLMDGASNPPPTEENMQAKERLGKTVTVRRTPAAVSGNATGEVILPYAIVNYEAIVADDKFPGNPDYKWLKLSEGRYVNFMYPPNGLRFDLIGNPPPPPPPDGETITHRIDVHSDGTITIDGNPYP